MEHQFGLTNDTQWGLDNYEQWFGGVLPAIVGVLGYYKSNPYQLLFASETIMHWIKSELYKIYYLSEKRG